METPDFSKSSFDKLLKPIENLLRILSKTSPQTFQNKQPKSWSLKLTLKVYLWNSQNFLPHILPQIPVKSLIKILQICALKFQSFLVWLENAPKFSRKLCLRSLPKVLLLKSPWKLRPKFLPKLILQNLPKIMPKILTKINVVKIPKILCLPNPPKKLPWNCPRKFWKIMPKSTA